MTLNRTMLTDVLATVEHIDSLDNLVPLDKRWEQGSWRALEIKDDRCNSAMCFAGWTVEVDKAEWLVNPKTFKHFMPTMRSFFSEYVLLKADDTRFDGLDAYSRASTFAEVCKALGHPVPSDLTDLADRKIMEARHYARVVLGLDTDQASELFDADNTLEVLRDYISDYLEQDEA